MREPNFPIVYLGRTIAGLPVHMNSKGELVCQCHTSELPGSTVLILKQQDPLVGWGYDVIGYYDKDGNKQEVRHG